MTFEEFQATGKDCVDISIYEHLEAQGLSGAGRIYAEELCIEGIAGSYCLTIGNTSISETTSDSLQMMERKLYDWAVDEGYLAATGKRIEALP